MRPWYRMGDTRRMPNSEAAWSFEHTIECDAPVEFAWGFWTQVRNWLLDADVVFTIRYEEPGRQWWRTGIAAIWQRLGL